MVLSATVNGRKYAIGMTDTPNHKRRFQFSLGTLLLSVLLASIPLGWLAMELQRTREQRQATEELISQSIRTADRIVITRGDLSRVRCDDNEAISSHKGG